MLRDVRLALFGVLLPREGKPTFLDSKVYFLGAYRVYSQISVAWNKHNGAAFSNSEHSDLIFLTKKITKKLNCQFPQTLLAEICSKPVSKCP